MHLLRKTVRGFGIAVFALGLLLVDEKSSSAFVNGQYNLIRIQVCVSDPQADQDFLVVYDSITGGALVMADAVAILAVLPICHPGGAFYAFLSNGTVTNVAIVPGLQ